MFVSIIIPTFNNEDYISFAIESVLAQTYPKDKFELIIVDDASTDGTGRICDAYAEKHKNIKVIHRVENSGFCSTPRNDGLDAAKGDYIYYLDGDDWLGPEAIERLVHHAVNHDSEMVFGRSLDIDYSQRAFSAYNFRIENPSLIKGDPIKDYDFYRTIVTRRLTSRSLLLREGIRSPECWFDDDIWSFNVILTAKNPIVVNDYDYYFWRRDHDIRTLTKGLSPIKRPENLLEAINRLFDLVDRYVGDITVASGPLIKLFSKNVIGAVEIIKQYSEAFPDSYPDGGISYMQKVWDRAKAYLNDDVRRTISIQKCLMYDWYEIGEFFPQHMIFNFLTGEEKDNLTNNRTNKRNLLHIKDSLPQNLSHISICSAERLMNLQLSKAQVKLLNLSREEDGTCDIIKMDGELFFPFYLFDGVEMNIVLDDLDGNTIIINDVVRISEVIWGEKYQKKYQWSAEMPLNNQRLKHVVFAELSYQGRTSKVKVHAERESSVERAAKRENNNGSLFCNINDAYTEIRLITANKDNNEYQLHLNELFVPWDNNNRPVIRCRKGICELDGGLRVVKEFETRNDNGLILTEITQIPPQFAPTRQINVVCQASGTSEYTLRINPSGIVQMMRYRDHKGYKSVTAGTWLTFHVVWTI